jgi:death on curing protein
VEAPFFLDKRTVVGLHGLQIQFFGGQSGLADEGLLESAVAAPIHYFLYANEKNLFDLSACYTFHLVKNHPFIDGNKRTALAAGMVFLKANSIAISIREKILFKAVLGLTTSRITKSQFSAILRDNSPLEFAFMANLYSGQEDRVVKPRRGIFC